MRPEDILKLLRKRPFEPFRICLSDGVTCDIRHPELAIVDRSTVTVGIPSVEGPDGPVERTVLCSLIHITHAQRIDDAVHSS